MKNNILLIIFLSILLSVSIVSGQGRLYEGPIDPAGDQAAIRENIMSGNRFRLYFNNQGRVGHWPYLDGSRFPSGSQQGLDLVDSNILIIGAQTFVKDDSIPIEKLEDVAALPPESVDTLYYMISGRTDHTIDTSPDGLVEWGFEPVFGYFNVSSESPAISTDPDSWPPDGWPSTGFDKKWPGLWNGRFGAFPYADLESYYVMNDAQDQENLQPSRTAIYSPRAASGVKIGDLRPNVTTQYGLPWGGVGIRVASRGYQWNNAQTRDIIFWEYDVTNISDYNLPQVVFGFMMDLGVGHFLGTGDGQDDVGSFNKDLDMSFCWDTNGKGYSGYLTGTLGFAFLESPGTPNDTKDNDNDGLIDEKRDNPAGNKIGPLDGIANLAAFTEFYGMQASDLKEHYEGDEDQDWHDGVDLNNNRKYDSGELAGDDVGLDGLGPSDVGYPGPDPDSTECNHRPDYQEGIGAEPNFAITDVSESDMIGLSTYHLFIHHDNNPQWWVMQDKTAYEHFSNQELDDSFTTPVNLEQTFSSGPFPLYKGRTERISMAVIASFENIATLENNREAPIQFARKKVVQTIYENDYRFARPPIMPTLTATPADGKVILTWDSKSDIQTRESLLSGANDFEGYRLYKATDREFSDADKLVDGFGNPAGRLPVFQCDLKNDYSGFTDYAFVEGEGYYLGANTGIQHYYIDEDVQNGRTYYYYLTAYDRGIKSMDIAPSENVATLITDENEIITFRTPNIQVIVPRPPVTGEIAPEIMMLTDLEDLSGTGMISLDISEPASLKPGTTYKLKFQTQQLNASPRIPEEMQYQTNGFSISLAENDSVIYEENPSHYSRINLLYETVKINSVISNQYYLNDLRPVVTDLFDGVQLTLSNLVRISVWDSLNTGWVQGGSPINVNLGTASESYGWDYDIIFVDEANQFTSQYAGRTIYDINQKTIRNALLEQTFPFYVVNRNFIDPETGDYEKLELVGQDINGNGTFDILEDAVLAGYTWRENKYWAASIFDFNFNDALSEDELPQPGDVYRIKFIKPFASTDSVLFRVLSPEDRGITPEENLKEVKVVPNPYIVTNTLEPAVRNNQLNQRRRIMFTHIPAKCTIKIFTMSGYLVDTIEVDNDQDNGIVQWDLLTKEDLEVAAGVYLYHIKSHKTGKEKVDKFAVIK